MAELGLFAGVDSAGAIRFVSDVPRGIACGCFCAGCGSPLVAKRGEVNVWHFAHEASQERPECLVGAANLLRRLAIEHLEKAEHIDLPEYRALIRAGRFPRMVQKYVAWTPRFRAIASWSLEPAQRAKVAQFFTEDNVIVALYVDVATRSNEIDADEPRSNGAIHFLIPMPEHGQLRSLSDAIEHILVAGHLQWIHLPDVSDQMRIAQDEANAESAKLEAEYEFARVRSEKVRQEILGLRKLSAPQLEVSCVSAQTRLDNPFPSADTPWAKWRKPNTTFMFYGLRDGTSWIIVTHEDGRLVAVPWPLFDGWDESLPERLGKADLSLGGVPLGQFELMMSYLRDKQIAMNFSTTWQDILNVRWPPA